jgi:hypothetical protein
MTINTMRQRVGMPRSFFERIDKWRWDDAPVRIPIFGADLPLPDESRPKARDDAAAVRFFKATSGRAMLARLSQRRQRTTIMTPPSRSARRSPPPTGFHSRMPAPRARAKEPVSRSSMSMSLVMSRLVR